MKKARVGITAFALFLTSVVGIQASIFLSSWQRVNIKVEGGASGMAASYNYSSGELKWEGPHNADFQILWQETAYGRWVGVFTYSLTASGYQDAAWHFDQSY